MIQVKVCRGDATEVYKRPVPFLDDRKVEIGQVTALAFDGMYTVAVIKLNDEGKRRLAHLYPFERIAADKPLVVEGRPVT